MPAVKEVNVTYSKLHSRYCFLSVAEIFARRWARIRIWSLYRDCMDLINAHKKRLKKDDPETAALRLDYISYLISLKRKILRHQFA